MANDQIGHDELYATAKWCLERGILEGLLHAAYLPRPDEIDESHRTEHQMDALKRIAKGIAFERSKTLTWGVIKPLEATPSPAKDSK